MSDSQSEDHVVPENVDPACIYRLILQMRSDVLREIGEQREQWQEAELVLLERGTLHRRLIDAQSEALEELQAQVESMGEQLNSMSEELKELRGKTEPAPPPDPETSG